MLAESRTRLALVLAVLGVAALLASPADSQLTSIGSQFWDQDSAGIEGTSEFGDDFGHALATGDFNCDGFADLAIGVPYEDVTYDCDGDGTADPNECSNAGAVQILYGSAQGLHASLGHADQLFTQDSSGVPGAPEVADHFGMALAALRVPGSDCDDLAVGAPEEDITSGPLVHVNAGAVFYFRGRTGALTPDGIFVQGQDGVPDLSEDDDRFGSALAPGPSVFDSDSSFCDLTPDGHGQAATLAIGARGEDLFPGFDDNGAVIVVVAPCQPAGAGSGSLPSRFNCGSSSTAAPCQEVYGGGVAQARAGTALAGRTTLGRIPREEEYLAIGVPGAGAGAPVIPGGRVEILQHEFPDEILYRDSCIQGVDGAAGAIETDDDLGASIALGDFDGDGFVDLAAGVPFEDVNGNSVDDAGGVSVFYAGAHGGATYPAGGGPPTAPFFDQDTTHFDAAEDFDHFGAALAAGDFNNDGRDDLVIGVPDEDIGSDDDAGFFHILYGTASGLSTTGDQGFDLDDPNLPGNSQPSDFLGGALAAGDFDGDGKADLAVAAPGGFDSTTSGGGVFVLYGGLPGGFLDAIDFDRTPSAFTEGATITATVQRTGSVILPLDVTYTHFFTGTNPATVGVDYIDFGGNLHWNAGDRSDKTFTITLINDSVDEPPESLVVGLDAGGIHCQEPSNWTITINDNDPNVPGTIQLSTASQTRAENGGPVTVTVNRVAGTTANATVHYATADGTALGGDDYTVTSGTLTFALNQLSQSFQIPILNDPWDEAAAETFTLTLSSPGGGAVLGSPTTQTISILDNDGDTGLFGDGFESGNFVAWSATVP